MAKSSRKSLDKASAPKSTAKSFISVDEKKIDSNLSSLFATSVRLHFRNAGEQLQLQTLTCLSWDQ